MGFAPVRMLLVTLPLSWIEMIITPWLRSSCLTAEIALRSLES